MMRFFRTRVQSFRYAFAGWRHVLVSQQNAWIHAAASIAVFAMATWLRLGRLEWAILLLTVAMVWMAEFINTALEAVVDLASPERHELARVSKDVGAAAVLITALASVLIGLLVLGPPLWEKIQVVVK